MERPNRSQASILREQKLRDSLSACLTRSGLVEKLRVKAEADAETSLTAKIAGQPGGVAYDRRRHEIEDMKGEEKALKDRAASLRSQIEAERPTAAQNRARAKAQKLIAKQLRGLVRQAEIIDGAVLNLKVQLESGQKTLAETGAVAGTIELTLPRLWSATLDEMLGSLPGEIAPEIRKSASAFLGEDDDARPRRYVVRRKVLTLPETLLDHGVYSFGEEAALSEEQAAKLLRDAPKSDPPIVPLEGAAVLKPGAKKVKVEVLQRVEHDHVLYDPGVHMLPRATALALLAVTIPVTHNKPGSGVLLDAEPVARLCV